MSISDNSTPINCATLHDHEDSKIREFVSTAAIVGICLIGVPGVIGNILMLRLVRYAVELTTCTKIIFVNFIIVSILFLILSLPITMLDYIQDIFLFGHKGCQIIQYCIHVLLFASTYSIMALCADRVLELWKAKHSSRYYTSTTAGIIVTMIWLTTLLANIPVYWSHGTLSYTYNCKWMETCVFLWEMYDEIEHRWGIISGVVIVPFILFVLLLSFAWFNRLSPATQQDKYLNRFTVITFAVGASFLFCWCPYCIILVLKSMDLYQIHSSSIITQILMHKLCYLFYCLTPIIFIAAYPTFRQNLNCNRHHHQHDTTVLLRTISKQ